MDALFGGSFDPVHLGHLVVAETAAEALGGATIRFMPAREQPFKRAAHQATPEQRADMLALAVRDNPRLQVERVEFDLPVPSYTVRTLRALGPRHPLIRRVIEVPAIAVSATDVRERVRAGRSIRYLVPEAVREYIAAHGLYR